VLERYGRREMSYSGSGLKFEGEMVIASNTWLHDGKQRAVALAMHVAPL